MARWACWAVLVLLTTASARAQQPAVQQPGARLESLTWLAGTWVERTVNATTEEQWLAPAGGLMLGVNRTVASNG